MKFNPFKYVDDLKEAGFPAKQAEAQVKVWSEFVESELATKKDIKELEFKIENVKSELKRDIKELELRLTVRLGGIMVLGIGVLAAIIKLT